ncbi:MAG: ATP phosphoribosyltransferase [Pseudomonadota bacterium]
MSERRAKIAIQKSGRLTEHSLEILTRCGLQYSRGRDELVCFGENMPIDILLVRDDDIPQLVSEGTADIGIVGLNVAEEMRLSLPADERDASFDNLGGVSYGHCRLCIARPADEPFDGPQSLAGKRIATTYPNLLRRYLDANDISNVEVVKFSGAVEIAPRLGKADFICDLVSSGSTLRANQLEEVLTVMHSEAVMIRHSGNESNHDNDWIDRLVQRMEGVLQVRESKYIMLHAPRAALPAITALLPGSEGPTVMPLEGCDEKVAVHAVCRENVFWETLEALKAAGASSMLVLPVEKMLA